MNLPRRGTGKTSRPAERLGPYADNHGITMAIAAVAQRTGGIGAEPRRAQLDLLDRVKETRLPFAELLGIEFVSAAPEKIVAKMTVREDLCTRPAVLHGGAIMAFADTLGAVATIVNLRQGAGTSTIESKTNFVASAPVGTRVIGETSPVHRGRRTMVWQTRVATEEGRLIALVTQTQLVL
jgi:1,4-dihydroxy-2-naphthoyl-CoA hydrolase